MKLYNTLTKKVDAFNPIHPELVRVYSCGPTVYDHIHIGNLSSFIYADTLRRALKAADYKVRHVMNFTDVDDKTIRRSRQQYPDLAAMDALKKLTKTYSELFLKDMQAIGNNIDELEFIRATDSIEGIRQLIKELYQDGFAYMTDDGVYFSIEKYVRSGKTYGQLSKVTANNTSQSRIDNDEYDKDDVHDFALWKVQKAGEPAWEFELDGRDLTGRPGWHIECSVMSMSELGQPFDIHTGGVDLIFPHHENEIAQSTAGAGQVYAKYFFHNEHLLVNGKKMSKSLKNFYTLEDIEKKGYDPLAFRLMVLQSHYRSQSNFTWENLEAAQNRLKEIRNLADLRWQPKKATKHLTYYDTYTKSILDHIQNDLNTPMVLAVLSGLTDDVDEAVSPENVDEFISLLKLLDDVLGLELLSSNDISNEQKDILQKRELAREAKDWDKSDDFRTQLEEQGLGVRDTGHGQIWFRL